MPTSLLAVLLLLVTAARADGGGTRVLLQSGERAADDRGLASFRSPVVGPKGAIGFFGTTSALFKDDRGVVSVVVETGDTVPPPLGGTFNEIVGSAINDRGQVAFVATLNTSSTTSGVFRSEGGNLVVLADGGSGEPDINEAGDVAFRRGNGISLVRGGSDAPVTIFARGDPAPGGGTFIRARGRPVLNDSSTMAFVGEVRGARRSEVGLFVWQETTGLRAVAREGDASPSGAPFVGFDRREAIAISPSGGVIFVGEVEGGRVGVFQFDPAGSHMRAVATTGDTIDGRVLTDILDRFVGSNARGDVAFVGEFDRQRRLVLASASGAVRIVTDVAVGSDLPPRLTDAGKVVWLSGGQVVSGGATQPSQVRGGSVLTQGFVLDSPDVNEGDVTIFRGARTAAYRAAAGELAVLARGGDEVAGFGVIRGLGRIALGARATAILAQDGADRVALLVARPGGLRKLVADGDPGPSGGTFALGNAPPVVRDGRVMFQAGEVRGETVVAGLYDVSVRGGRIRRILHAGETRPGSVTIYGIGEAAWLEGKVVLDAALDLEGLTTGVVLVRRQRRVKLAATGDVVAGRPITFVGRPTVRGSRVIFGAGLAGDPPGFAVLAWEKGKLLTLFVDTPAAGGVPIDVATNPIAPVRAAAAFVGAQRTGDVTHRGLFAIRRQRLVPLALDGDVSPLGGTILLPEGDIVAAMGREVVFAADLFGASAARALLAASR